AADIHEEEGRDRIVQRREGPRAAHEELVSRPPAIARHTLQKPLVEVVQQLRPLLQQGREPHVLGTAPLHLIEKLREVDLLRELGRVDNLLIERQSIALHELDRLVSKTPPQLLERPLARAGPVASRPLEDDGQATPQVLRTKFGRRELLAAIQ